jgi:hypothetical protein
MGVLNLFIGAQRSFASFVVVVNRNGVAAPGLSCCDGCNAFMPSSARRANATNQRGGELPICNSCNRL